MKLCWEEDLGRFWDLGLILLPFFIISVPFSFLEGFGLNSKTLRMYFCFCFVCVPLSHCSWQLLGLVPAVVLARFSEVICHCLLPTDEKKWPAQVHPTGSVPKMGLELMVCWFPVWYFNHCTKLSLLKIFWLLSYFQAATKINKVS